jgi:hypothetical protein
MARTALTVNQIVRAGLADPTAEAGQADGHKVSNDGTVFLEFTNGVASARIVTVQTAATVGDLAVEDVSVTVPSSAQRFKAGPFDMALFNRPAGDTDAGYFYLDYPAGQEADLTVRAYTL